MTAHTAHHLCPCVPVQNLPSCLTARSRGCLSGGQGSGVKGHIPDGRIHTLIKNSAAQNRTELAGG